jgi:hypothetical protein
VIEEENEFQENFQQVIQDMEGFLLKKVTVQSMPDGNELSK